MTTTVQSTRNATAPSRSVLYGVLILAALSATGAAISVASDLSPTWLDGMGPEGRLAIPWPMTLFQVAMALLAGSTRRIPALVGSAVVALALLLGVISGFFDGGYGDDRLTGWEQAYQIGFIAGLVVVGVIAARRFVQVLRPA